MKIKLKISSETIATTGLFIGRREDLRRDSTWSMIGRRRARQKVQICCPFFSHEIEEDWFHFIICLVCCNYINLVTRIIIINMSKIPAISVVVVVLVTGSFLQEDTTENPVLSGTHRTLQKLESNLVEEIKPEPKPEIERVGICTGGEEERRYSCMIQSVLEPWGGLPL